MGIFAVYLVPNHTLVFIQRGYITLVAIYIAHQRGNNSVIWLTDLIPHIVVTYLIGPKHICTVATAIVAYKKLFRQFYTFIASNTPILAV